MNTTRPHWPPGWLDITDPMVLDAMTSVPRHLFVPVEFEDEAYEDAPLPIGLNQTISQPYIVALMTQALRLERDSRVLEVGTGSGYQAAILAYITPHVWSIETLPLLANSARERLQQLGYPVVVQTGDGRLGWPEHAPYDAIIVTAAPTEVPPALVQQLGKGGRLVIPLGAGQWEQVLWRIEKDEAGLLHAKQLGNVRFVPLTGSQTSGPEDPEQAAIRAEIRALLRR